jgi:hypothetical protein
MERREGEVIGEFVLLEVGKRDSVEGAEERRTRVDGLVLDSIPDLSVISNCACHRWAPNAGQGGAYRAACQLEDSRAVGILVLFKGVVVLDPAFGAIVASGDTLNKISNVY